MQKQLIEYEEEEREHKRKFCAKKLASFQLRDDDFEANAEEDDSGSSMGRYVTSRHAEEDKQEDEEGDPEVTEDVSDHPPYKDVPIPNVAIEVEVIDVDLLDD